MQRLSWFFIVVMIGCGGNTSTQSAAPALNGNFDFVTDSNLPTFHVRGPLTTDSAGNVTGTVHVDDIPACFDATADLALTGKVTQISGGAASFQLMAAGSSTISIGGGLVPSVPAGGPATFDRVTFNLQGSTLQCDGVGNVVVSVLPVISGSWTGTFTSGSTSFRYSGTLNQSGADAHGIFHLSGTLNSVGSPSCPSVTIQSSEVLGRFVSFSAPAVNDPANSVLDSQLDNDGHGTMIGSFSFSPGNPQNPANPCAGLSGQVQFTQP